MSTILSRTQWRILVFGGKDYQTTFEFRRLDSQDGVCRLNSKWKGFFTKNLFQVIAQIRSYNKRPDIYSHVVKIEKLKELSVHICNK